MDYVYIPLGGSRVKYGRHLTNLMITFLVSGIWHGANWTFVLWGALHGTFLIIDNMIKKFIYKPTFSTITERLANVIICFVLVAFAWIFFRANNAHEALTVIQKIFTDQGTPFYNRMELGFCLLSLSILIVKDVKDELKINLNFLHSKYTIIRYASAILLICYIMQMAAFNGGQFIYFQF